MSNSIRLGCTYCDRGDFDGVDSLPEDWDDVHEVRSLEEAKREVPFDDMTRSALASMGHQLAPMAGYFGDIQLIIRAPDGTLYGASDPRREGGRALGF